MSKDKKSCWYYDEQLENRLTSISLHVNTRFIGGEWKRLTDIQESTDDGGYSVKPLCRSIMNEDFNVTIGNTWSDLGGDPISGMVNDIMHSAAPYGNLVKSALKEIGDKANEWSEQHEQEYNEDGTPKFSLTQSVANWAAQAGQFANDHGDKILDFMNSHLIMQGTRFSYYGGTGVSFGNLGMRFTLFPQWDSGAFRTVNQQLEELFPYVIGKYESLSFDYKYKKDGEEVKEHFESPLIGWQKSPAGYQADYRDIDNKALKGTMKLRLGAFYVLEGLVCDNLNFNLSRQMVKKPRDAGYSGLNAGTERIKKIDPGEKTLNFSPLFADVVMNFRPATKYSDTAMRNFIYGLDMGGHTNEGAQDLSKDMNAELEEIRQEIKAKYV